MIPSKTVTNYPMDWDELPLGDLYYKIRNGFVGTATPYYVREEEGTKYLQGKDVKNGKISNKDLIYVQEDFHKKQSKSQLKINDLVMVQSGHVGECAVITKEFENSNCHALIVLTPNEKVDSNFYSYLFNSNIGKRLIYKIKTGNTIEHILASDMKVLKVPVPTYNEQKKISSILSSWDKAIELKEKLIEQKKEQKKGLMQRLLTGSIRLSGFCEDWNTMYLEEICVNKGLVRGPFGGALKKEYFVPQGYKVYEQKNAIYKDANLGDYYINENKFLELKRFEVKQGDFIVSCSGTIGRIYKIPDDSPKGVINQALLKITIDKKLIDSEYFYQYFQWEHFQNKIIENTQGGAMQNLVGMDIFRKTKIAVPNLLEQNKIASILSILDKEIYLEEQDLIQKKEQKKALMQQLLTGKIRVKV